jgi:type II secretory pathway pseudopilin PulG
MMKPNACLNRGVSYVECLVALAVLGMCVLILSPTIAGRKDHFRKTQFHLRAVTALASEADLIRRTRGPALSGGRHPFIQDTLLLKGLPGAEAHYEVSSGPLRGMARVTLIVSWRDRQRQSREMQIYVWR